MVTGILKLNPCSKELTNHSSFVRSETGTQEEVIVQDTVMKTGLHNCDLCSNAQPVQSY